MELKLVKFDGKSLAEKMPNFKTFEAYFNIEIYVSHWDLQKNGDLINKSIKKVIENGSLLPVQVWTTSFGEVCYAVRFQSDEGSKKTAEYAFAKISEEVAKIAFPDLFKNENEIESDDGESKKTLYLISNVTTDCSFNQTLLASDTDCVKLFKQAVNYFKNSLDISDDVFEEELDNLVDYIVNETFINDGYLDITSSNGEQGFLYDYQTKELQLWDSFSKFYVLVQEVPEKTTIEEVK